VLVLRVVLVLLHADCALRLGAFPARRRIVEYVERVTAAEELAPDGRNLLEHRVDPRVAIAANPAGVPIVQSRIAQSGVATIAAPNSGAIVSTAFDQDAASARRSSSAAGGTAWSSAPARSSDSCTCAPRDRCPSILEFGKHRMEHDLLAPSLHPLR